MEKTRAREIEGVSSWIRERRMLEINKKKNGTEQRVELISHRLGPLAK
jgi:hypothetical protein